MNKNIFLSDFEGKFAYLHFLQKQPERVRNKKCKIYGYLVEGTEVKIYEDQNMPKQKITKSGWYGMIDESTFNFKSLFGSSDLLELL